MLLFQTGRVVTAEGSAGCDGTFPDRHAGYDQTIAFLKTFFADLGLTDEEQVKQATALLGAHGLGKLFVDQLLIRI